IVVLDLATNKERVVATGYLSDQPLGSERPLEWSPDSKWIAFISARERLFSNVSVVAASGGDVHQISILANVSGHTVSWSPDGKFILMDTGQRTENGQIARIDLTLRSPKFREDQFRELFQEEKPGTPAKEQPQTKPAESSDTKETEKKTAPPKVEIN